VSASETSPRRQRLKLWGMGVLIGVLTLINGLLLNSERAVPEAPDAEHIRTGACITTMGPGGLTIVDCGSPEARYEVLGVCHP